MSDHIYTEVEHISVSFLHCPVMVVDSIYNGSDTAKLFVINVLLSPVEQQMVISAITP